MWFVKNQIWARGSGYLSGRYSKDGSTPLSPLKWVSTNKMKQVWQLIDWTWISNSNQMCESKTCMIINKSINTIGCEAYLSHKLSAIIRDKVSAQIQNNRMHVIEWGKPIKHSNQSISEKITYVGSYQNPIYLAWISLTNSIVLELWRSHSFLCKIKRNRRLFENQSGIKTVREKIGFLKFIWKFESRKLFENWSFEN